MLDFMRSMQDSSSRPTMTTISSATPSSTHLQQYQNSSNNYRHRLLLSSPISTTTNAAYQNHVHPHPQMIYRGRHSPPDNFQVRRHNQQQPRYHHQQYHQQPQQLGQKHRAKSVPNLDIAADGVPKWVRDGHTGVTYTVGQLLGRGGFAKCFLACSNRQYFAMKVISRETICRQVQQLGKIRREIQTHFSLRHPNIVALYSAFECPQNIYMLMELCPNRTLAELIDRSPGRCLTEQMAIIYMRQLLSAVHYLHEDCGLVHRDIKPGNVLFSREWTVKLADFGFCCSIGELASRQAHTICGTPNYVAAEIIDKCGHTIYSDCWALACTFYTMLFGRPPFHSDNLNQTYSRIRRCQYTFTERYGISEGAKDLIRRTLIPHPEYRLKVVEMLEHSVLNPHNGSFERSPSHESNNSDAAMQSQFELSGQSGGSRPSSSQTFDINNPPSPIAPAVANLLPTIFGWPQNSEEISAELLMGNNTINGVSERNGSQISQFQQMPKLPALDNFSSFLPAIDASATAVFPMSAENATEMGGFMMDAAGLSTLAPSLPSSSLNFTAFFGGDTFSANLTAGQSGPSVGIGSGTADSGLGSGEPPLGGVPNELGPLGRAVHYTLDKFTQALQSIIDEFNPLNLMPFNATLDTLPASFVAKWVDYTNKFGFGLTLRDGTRSILFNDHSSLSATPNQRHFSFRQNKFDENCIEWSYSDGFPNSDICEKISFMSILRDYMDRELYSTLPIVQQHNWRPLVDILRRNRIFSPKKRGRRMTSSSAGQENGEESHPPLVHIIDFRKFSNALFIFLSDGTCQVNFSDTHHKLIMSVVPDKPAPHIYQLHLITADQRIFCYRTTNTFELDQVLAPPLSDNGWAMVRAFQRVLQSYQHRLLNRQSLLNSTYC